MRFKALTIIPHNGEFEIRPLVLCRDCKWWKTHGATSLRWLPCMDKHTFPDWYCADGVKGEDDEADDAAPVRHGRWVKLDMHKGMADHKCTSCGMEVYVPTSWGEPLYGYCPVCGAKMDEGEDDAVSG